jgi:hypothetical protein
VTSSDSVGVAAYALSLSMTSLTDPFALVSGLRQWEPGLRG